jgi:hypothetical protein
MLRKAALVFGVVFVLIGILGFVPALRTNNNTDMPLLLGLFMVGGVHNAIHLISGVGALLGSKTEKYSQLYFRVFGVVYGLVTIIGFVQKTTVLGIIDVNMADNFLHLAIALASLTLGFAVTMKPASSAKNA